MEERKKGPVEILCKEIEFPFERRMETVEILVAFVDQLVNEVASTRYLSARISHMTGSKPSDESASALSMAQDMLRAKTREQLIACAANIHNSFHLPDEGPCDHLIDMIKSCASAIRFGLEVPCVSRHAAHAASHVWEKRYGISLHDDLTPHWEKHWARVQLQKAITNLALKRCLPGDTP